MLAKAGGIIPLAAEGCLDACENPAALEVLCFTVGDGVFELYEDNGQNGQGLRSATTTFTMSHKPRVIEIIISPDSGAGTVLPPERQYSLTVYGIKDCGGVTARLTPDGSVGVNVIRSYDPVRKAMTLKLPQVNSSVQIDVAINDPVMAENTATADAFDILHKAQIEHELKTAIYNKIKNSLSNERLLGELVAMKLEPPLLGALTEVITACV